MHSIPVTFPYVTLVNISIERGSFGKQLVFSKLAGMMWPREQRAFEVVKASLTSTMFIAL